MSSTTDNLKLYKADPVTDGNDTFNIDTMLNQNWDAVDTAVKAADDKANQAASEAVTLSNQAKTDAIAAAATDATTKANKAKADAITEAASDATTKANNAKTAAISAAAADAASKADKAKTDAIAAASADAASKANTAQANAKAYTDEQVGSLSDVVAGVQHYNSFADIDPTYTNDTLFATVYNAMAANSILRSQVSANATDYPADGLLEVIKQDASHGACTLSAADGVYNLSITPENIEQIFGGGGVR